MEICIIKQKTASELGRSFLNTEFFMDVFLLLRTLKWKMQCNWILFFEDIIFCCFPGWSGKYGVLPASHTLHLPNRWPQRPSADIILDTNGNSYNPNAFNSVISIPRNKVQNMRWGLRIEFKCFLQTRTSLDVLMFTFFKTLFYEISKGDYQSEWRRVKVRDIMHERTKTRHEFV